MRRKKEPSCALLTIAAEILMPLLRAIRRSDPIHASQKQLGAVMMGFWKVMCQTSHHPGQWNSWFREQCCAVGWPPSQWRDKQMNGWSYESEADNVDRAWKTARNRLREMRAGDGVIAFLPFARVARAGEIVRLEVADGEWNPIVEPSSKLLMGENGRRIIVRWNLSIGPADANVVVNLPDGLRANGQASISRLSEIRFSRICEAMGDERNWVPIHGAFAFETALSDYIAMHPHRLEDGMIAHSSAPKIREWTIAPGHRIDVVLQDRRGQTVLVECKQAGLMVSHIEQLDRYLTLLRKFFPEWRSPRGVLVHGGTRNVTSDLRELARKRGVTLVHHELRVDFSSSG